MPYTFFINVKMASVTNGEHVKSIFIGIRAEDTVISTSRVLLANGKRQ